MNCQTKLVFSSERLKITANLFPSDTIFVTFQSAVSVGLERTGFAEEFLKKHSIAAICMNPVNVAWYQYPDMVEACAAIKELTSGYKRVITYGMSMGGYAAINFAELVGATDVIAISPQYTIDPARAPDEVRYSNAFKNINGFTYDQPSGRNFAAIDGYLIFDQFDKLDRYQAALATAEIAINLVKLPHSTHPVTQVLSIEALKNFVLSSAQIGVKLSIPKMIRDYKKCRAESWLYWLNLARNYGATSPKKALLFAQEADRLNPRNKDVLHVVGSIHLALGNFLKAIKTFNRGIAIAKDNPWLYSGKASAFIGMGDAAKAARAIAIAEKCGLPVPNILYLRDQASMLPPPKESILERAKAGLFHMWSLRVQH